MRSARAEPEGQGSEIRAPAQWERPEIGCEGDAFGAGARRLAYAGGWPAGTRPAGSIRSR